MRLAGTAVRGSRRRGRSGFSRRGRVLAAAGAGILIQFFSGGGVSSAPPAPIGYDISFPQCGGPFPSQPYQFAVVGVNRGRPNTANPCFAEEYHWATGALDGKAAVYLNTSWGASAGGPRRCGVADGGCLAYNYGYDAAHRDLEMVAAALGDGAHPAAWWLDVETANRWSDDRAQNAAALQGMIDGLRSDPTVAAIGAYSTSYQWSKIAGAFRPGLPSWVAGALAPVTAPLDCVTATPFAGDAISMVQYPMGTVAGGQYDGDDSC